jgi:PAS domain S-box-containing protein
MHDRDRSREELLEELRVLRQRVRELERAQGSGAEESARNAELQERLTLLLQILDAPPILIAYVDPELRYVFNNRTYEEWLGHAREEYKGKTIREVVGEPLYACLEPFYARALKGETVTFEVAARQSGMPRSVQLTLTPQVNAAGAVQGIVILVEDIGRRKRAEEDLLQAQQQLEQRVAERTAELSRVNAALSEQVAERQRAEDALRVTQTRLETAQARAGLGHWEFDPHTARGYWSREMYHLYRRDPDLGPPTSAEFLDLIHPEDRQAVADTQERAFRGQTPLNLDFRTNPERGPVRHLDARVHCVRGADGQPLQVAGTILDITARKEAEEELRRNYSILHAVLEGTTDAVFVKDLQGRYLMINTAGARFIGKTPPEVLGQDDAGLLTPDTARRIMADDHQILATGVTRTLEEVLTAAGVRLTFLTTKGTYRDAQGNVIGVIGISRDITERKRAEETVRESEERYRCLFAALAEGVVFQDLAGVTQTCNASAERILGLTLDQMNGRSPFDPRWRAVHEDGTPFSEETYPAAVTLRMGKGCSNVVMGIHKPDAPLTWIVVNSEPLIRPEEDRPYGVVCSFSDITERKLAEEALRESEERWRTVVETVPDFIITMDQHGTIQFINRVHPGYRREHVIGSSAYGYMPSAVHAPFRAALQRLFQRGEPFELEFEAAGSPGEMRYYVSRGCPLRRGGKIVAALSVASDITVNKRDEERLRASLREKESLLQEIHHRVKNNLQIISSLLALQEAQLREPAALNVFTESQNRIRAMALIHESLYRSGNVARIDFAQHVDSLCAYLFRSYGVDPSRIELHTHIIEASFGLERAIPCGLLLNELVSNSLKYAFPQGKRGRVTVELHAPAPGTYSMIVADNGIGLPPDLDIHRTDSLGLQLVCTLTKQLGGSVCVDRTGGTTFQITFAA